MVFDDMTEKIMQLTLFKASEMGSEFVTPEHVLFACLDLPVFKKALVMNGGDPKVLKADIDDFLSTMLPEKKKDEGEKKNIGDRISDSFANMIETAVEVAEHTGSKYICLYHVIFGLSRLHESFAEYFLSQQVGRIEDFLSTLQLLIDGEDELPFGNSQDRDDDESADENWRKQRKGCF